MENTLIAFIVSLTIVMGAYIGVFILSLKKNILEQQRKIKSLQDCCTDLRNLGSKREKELQDALTSKNTYHEQILTLCNKAKLKGIMTKAILDNTVKGHPHTLLLMCMEWHIYFNSHLKLVTDENEWEYLNVNSLLKGMIPRAKYFHYIKIGMFFKERNWKPLQSIGVMEILTRPANKDFCQELYTYCMNNPSLTAREVRHYANAFRSGEVTEIIEGWRAVTSTINEAIAKRSPKRETNELCFVPLDLLKLTNQENPHD